MGIALGILTLSAPELLSAALRPIVGEPAGTSSAEHVARKASYSIYGLPEGEFETTGAADWEGWVGVDNTLAEEAWQISTFNAANLNANGAGNNAAWAGFTDLQKPSWTDAPGYGNQMEAILCWRAVTSNTSAAQSVGLDFWFNLDSEPGADFFVVQYLNLDGWQTVYEASGFLANAQYAAQGAAPITYVGNDYAGPSADEIIIRLVAFSDGAGSDEDGRDSNGLVQLDDIGVTYDGGGGLDFNDFETDWGNWSSTPSGFGNYAKLVQDFQSIDPCKDNSTWVVAFLDDGTAVPDTCSAGNSTGGTVSPNWSYGVPGGWVLNYLGGPTPGGRLLDNDVESPPIPWDLPGIADDLAEGAVLRFDVFEHLPLANGIFWTWSIRSSDDGGANWSDWRNRGFVYYRETAQWTTREIDISNLVLPNRTDLQVRLGVKDLSLVFGFAGDDATPSPLFDNVEIEKYDITGPVVEARDMFLFQDSFPQSGNIDVSTQASRDAADCRLDAAVDVGAGNVPVPADEMSVDVTPLGSGVTLNKVEFTWQLDVNPFFEMSIRGNLVGATVFSGAGINGWDRYEKTEPATHVDVVAAGNPLRRAYFDLPDDDFMYPGDVLSLVVEAEDSNLAVTSLPTAAGDRRFTVRALPSIVQPFGDQPEVLFVNDNGHGDHEAAYINAFNSAGLNEGVEFDTYTVKDPALGQSNGIGSAGAHGANPAQLSGYSCIFYASGRHPYGISDGSDTGLHDKSDDLGVIRSWQDQAADRYVAYFGDKLVTGLASSAVGLSHVTNRMQVDLLGPDIEPFLGTRSPDVIAVALPFTQDFSILGGCPNLRFIDAIDPLASGPAIVAHRWDPGSGQVISPVASVMHDRLVLGFQKVDLTYAIDLDAMIEIQHKDHGPTARSEVIKETLILFGGSSGIITDVPSVARGLSEVRAQPNPFNPATTLSFELGAPGRVEVELFDVRGKRVATLVDGSLAAGTHAVRWDGTDGSGSRVASGVYYARVRADGRERRAPLVLLK